MRISDLSRESGIPIPTIKFYLREGILEPGRRTAPNQARYDEGHLRRLHLVKVLVETGGLSLAAVRSVLGALERTGATLHEALAEAHRALRRDPIPPSAELAAARTQTDAWLAQRGWDLGPDSGARDDLAGALLALRQLGWEVGPEVFDRYASAADEIAAAELAYVAGMPTREAAVEATVVGTVVFEQALLALRRLAQERHSRARWHAARWSDDHEGGSTRGA